MVLYVLFFFLQLLFSENEESEVGGKNNRNKTEVITALKLQNLNSFLVEGLSRKL